MNEATQRRQAKLYFVQDLTKTVFVIWILLVTVVMFANAIASFQSRGTLLDCTQPTGQCYQRGQQHTAELVKKLIDENHKEALTTNQIVQIAVACGDAADSQTYKEISNCVERKVNEGRP